MIWKYLLLFIVQAAGFLMVILLVASFWIFTQHGGLNVTHQISDTMETYSYVALAISALLTVVRAIRELSGKKND